MGIVSGFVGGAGDAMEFAGKTYLTQQVSKEKDEANALRKSNLAGEEREFKSEENQKDRDSAERVAGTKAKGAAGKDGLKYSFTMNGRPVKYSDVLDTYKSEKGIESDSFTLPKNMEDFNSWLNRNNYKMVGSVEAFKSDVQSGVLEPSTSDYSQARKEYEEKAKVLKSDKSQFGMSEDKFVEKRAKELRDERLQKGKKTGIVGSESKAPKKPKENKPSGKRVGDSPYDEGTKLQKDGKTYIVKNGKPQLVK